MYLYGVNESIDSGYLTIRQPEDSENGHPVVLVEVYSHAIRSHRVLQMPSDYTIVYRVGKKATLPNLGTDNYVVESAYKLKSINETLWAQREKIGDGQLFDQLFEYKNASLPTKFDGDNYNPDTASTPWSYTQAVGTELEQGDWFFDPAKAFAYYASIQGDYSLDYEYNTYLDDIKLGSR